MFSKKNCLNSVNGFVGCLRNFTIQGVNVNRTTANATPGVLFGGRDLPDHCKGQGHIQCQNGGLCRSDWFTSYCDCSRTGYEGPTCSLCEYHDATSTQTYTCRDKTTINFQYNYHIAFWLLENSRKSLWASGYCTGIAHHRSRPGWYGTFY